MDRVQQTLAEAAAFGREDRGGCAYYKYLDAVQHALEFLAKESLFRSAEGLERPVVEKILTICNRSLDRAGELLNLVLDLSDEEADAACSSGILSTQKPAPNSSSHIQGPLLERPDAYKHVQVGGASEDVDDREAVGSDKHDDFGPDVELSSRDASELPLIATSTLDMAHCLQVLQLQQLAQKLEQYGSATAKQRSNALYINALYSLVQKIQKSAIAKMEIEGGLQLARGMHIREIPPIDLARQVTLIQMDLFHRIEAEELRIPSSPERSFLAPNLTNFLSMSLFLCQWCQYEIVRYRRDTDRASVMGHIIKVANHLSDLSNYEGTKALITGLTAAPIQRLRQTVSLIPKKLRNQMDSLEILVSERRNFAQLRDVLAKKARPAIPYIGLYLGEQRIKGMSDPTLERFVEFQKSTYEGLIKQQPIVQHYILVQPFRWEEELYQLSLMREPRSAIGEKDASRTEDPVSPPMDLSSSEIDRLAYPQFDAYDILRRRIQRDDHFSRDSSDASPSHSPSIR